MKNPIKILPPNEHGRDFVVGDLHGSWSCLMNLLTNVNFDPTKDRLISVGDLVDRGPESLQCLELLYEPWFHAVLANHEQMMLEAFKGGYMGMFWLRNGGLWGSTALQLHKDKQRTFYTELDRPRLPDDNEVKLWDALEKVEALPYLITINMKDGKKFHVVHAELPPFSEVGKITDEDLADPVKVWRYSQVQSNDGDYLFWGRNLYYQFCKLPLDNHEKVKRTVAYHSGRGHIFNDQLSHVISGHTILQKPLTIMGQTNIDTGAFGSYASDAPKWNALTAIELGTWTFYQATEKEFRTVEPVEVNRADVEELTTKIFQKGPA